jgi:hypothetical protein
MLEVWVGSALRGAFVSCDSIKVAHMEYTESNWTNISRIHRNTRCGGRIITSSGTFVS